MSDTPSPPSTWEILKRRWRAGFHQLTEEEQQTIALWWLEAETMNGTLDQFFWNSAGDLALVARAGLVRLQQHTTLQALDSALAHFGPGYPTDRNRRIDMLEAMEAEHGEDVFEAPSRIIQDLPEDFVAAALEQLAPRYAREQETAQPPAAKGDA